MVGHSVYGQCLLAFVGDDAGYELAADGGLRTIYIHSARREKLATALPEGPTPDIYYSVDGRLLTLPYNQLLNLNISYFIDEEDAKKEGDEAPVINQLSAGLTTQHGAAALPASE